METSSCPDKVCKPFCADRGTALVDRARQLAQRFPLGKQILGSHAQAYHGCHKVSLFQRHTAESIGTITNAMLWLCTWPNTITSIDEVVLKRP